MPATIRDVAQLAGVSKSTVSSVINNKGYVGQETKAKILAAIEQLHYTPKRSARGLANRMSGNIGFIVSDTHFSRAEPFYTRVFLGSEFAARDYDLYVLLTSVDGRREARPKLPRFLLEQNVDGVIIAGRVPDALLKKVLKLTIPTVLVDYGDDRFGCSKVLIDNAQGALVSTRHLIELGHRNIAFVGGDADHPSALERQSGYERAMRQAQLSINPLWVNLEEREMSPEVGRIAFRRVSAQAPEVTAVVCVNDAVAHGVILEAHELGLRVPEDLSVVGFDDVPTSTLIEPQLTTVRVEKEELGATSMRVLVDQIHHVGPPSVTRVGVTFIQRASTAPVAQRSK